LVGAGVGLAVGVGVGPPPLPVPCLPPPVGVGVGVGVEVGGGVAAMHGFHQGQHLVLPGIVPCLHTFGGDVGVGVAVGEGVGLGAAAAPEAPASMSAKTPGSSATTARPLGRRRGVSLPNTFALIDVFQLWS
jgi:hypothetical protein